MIRRSGTTVQGFDGIELDELLIEGEEDLAPLADEAAPRRPLRRVLLGGGVLVAAVAAIASLGPTDDGTAGPPLTTVPTATSGDPRLTLLPVHEGDAILGLSRERAFALRVDDELGTVDQVLRRNGAILARLDGGTARWWTRGTPDGVDLGPADAVFPGPESDQVWLLTREGSRWEVRRTEVGDAASPSPAAEPVVVPRRGTVVGAVSGVLVTAGDGDGRSDVRLWDPTTGAEVRVARDAVVLASGADRLAIATGDDADDDGVGDDVAVLAGPAWEPVGTWAGIAGGVDGATFSDDGRFLALPRPGSGVLTTIDLDAGPAVVPATTELGDAADGPTAWLGDSFLVAAPDSYVVIVDPEDGDVRRVGPLDRRNRRT